MKIDEKLIEEIAKLARLEIENKQEFINEMQKIVDYFELLNNVDTEDIEPMYTPLESSASLRENAVVNFENVEGIRENFPEREGNYLKVPGIHK
ncbi:glutamyl-tRNA(Gln) amidotransferase subunit C [Thermosipho africanus H17ap60334]|uniref:Asp-tRNA(Asn)/Glu-tRNA(Gln) amidotransferase subunit GatC n=1 Tax=Thermosipho africanus TaxID=2421 RepID=UPI00028DFDB8|nr:Asp-tRNA(Asn)/Glu-tRNA(Gln) amidotransferase subunit GatC [Thermosipho africanus]EKF48702.1 glutamyl-tRNA(Gln) amidotransferase subunit C [Thermosipho africanus H17ap60334]